MAILVFDAADMRRVVDHALNAKAHSPRVVDYDKELNPITEPGKPSVILVHDQGVYILSNGQPRDLIDPKKTSAFAAYAKGCDPTKNPDEWWDTSRDMVGGDDFAETLPWAEDIKARLDRGAKTIRVKVTTEAMELLP